MSLTWLACVLAVSSLVHKEVRAQRLEFDTYDEYHNYMVREWYNDTLYPYVELTSEEDYFFNKVCDGLAYDDYDVPPESQAGFGCERKEYRALTDGERDALHSAMQRVHDSGEWSTLVGQHRSRSAPSAHFGPCFPTWHRVFLIRMERAIQQYCPFCCLPYWDSRLERYTGRPHQSALWHTDFVGNDQGAVTSGFASRWRPRAGCDVQGNGRLTRWVSRGSGDLYSNFRVDRSANAGSYRAMCLPYRRSIFESYHGRVHVDVNGHMASLSCSPTDPLFWMHHCMVDYIFEKCKDNLNGQVTYPTDSVPGGHRGTDTMRPFNQYRCADGLVDISITKEYYYAVSPAEVRCTTDSECGGGGLWCHSEERQCKAKIREGFSCYSVPNAERSCYCSRGGTPACVNQFCRCN